MSKERFISARIELLPIQACSSSINSNIVSTAAIYEIFSQDLTADELQSFTLSLTNFYTHNYRLLLNNASEGSITKVISNLEENFSIDLSLNFKWLIGKVFTNCILKTEALWGLEVSFLPGVTDNAANTVKGMIEERYDKKVQVRSKFLILGKGDLVEVKNFYNPLIQKAEISYLTDKYIQLPQLQLFKSILPVTKVINLNLPDIELAALSKSMLLGLSLLQLQVIRKYFISQNRSPTDIELETFAQTWSEHCKHNIFNSPLDEINEGIYKFYIKRATEEVRAKRDICVSVFYDNAGAIIFDEEWVICAKVETHNSPSALEPFGGAITGILGVNRDILGFGKGAKPIANNYAFCFVPPTYKSYIYYDKGLKNPMLSSDKIMNGVINGIKVGGNCSGIPTTQGLITFDTDYLAKPLVFAGTIGIIPKKIDQNPSHLKGPQCGDYIVVLGGRTGKDGIHGATFSSMVLNNDSPSSAVQVGDPITQKKLLDALVKEIRDLNLYNSITDCGAGGFSSAVGEMGCEGFEVWLEKAPLKYEGMMPWEIWISESQERMILSVPPQNIDKISEILKKHEVEFASIGSFNESGKGKVLYNNEKILELDLHFLHKKNPLPQLISKEIENLIIPQDKYSSLEEAISDINICSREFVIRQYDHTVQGSSFLGPLHGNKVDSSATVIKPVPLSDKGVIQSQAIAVIKDNYNPYYLTSLAIDRAIRHAVSMGASIKNLALLDNFCWSDSYNPSRLWQLKQAAKACYDYSTALEIPFISGKDSMFNNFEGYTEEGDYIKLRNPPTVLITAVGIVENAEKNCVTTDAKYPEDLIYTIGHNLSHKLEPLKSKMLYSKYNYALEKEIIVSGICIEKGGTLVALAKTLMGGNLGAEIWLNNSEFYNSNVSKILVTINPLNKEKFEECFAAIEFSYLGKTTTSLDLIINGTVATDCNKLLKSYKKFSLQYE